MLNTLLQAAPAAGQQQGSIWMTILPFALIIVIFYFFMMRPQQKRQKELAKFRDNLKKGDHVVTTGGVYAKVHEIKDGKVELEVADGVYVKFDKSAILEKAEANAQ
jgi:preprotein translocase subunit YajC